MSSRINNNQWFLCCLMFLIQIQELVVLKTFCLIMISDLRDAWFTTINCGSVPFSETNSTPGGIIVLVYKNRQATDDNSMDQASTQQRNAQIIKV